MIIKLEDIKMPRKLKHIKYIRFDASTGDIDDLVQDIETAIGMSL